MIRRPPRSTLSSSSAASDVYKRQAQHAGTVGAGIDDPHPALRHIAATVRSRPGLDFLIVQQAVVRRRTHDLSPTRLTVDPEDIGEGLVAIWRRRDQGRVFGNDAVARLPVERISPAMAFESRAPRRLQHFQKVNGPVQMPAFACDLVEV